MPDLLCSASKEVLRCRRCQSLIVAVTVEAPLDAERCLLMLDAILRASRVRDLLECDACLEKTAEGS